MHPFKLVRPGTKSYNKRGGYYHLVVVYYRWKRLYIAQAASQTKGSNSAGILSGEIPLMHSQFCCR